MYPKAPIVRRHGEVNAWDNAEFRAAVKATGKKQLIVAGITTDVRIWSPLPSSTIFDHAFAFIGDYRSALSSCRSRSSRRATASMLTPRHPARSTSASVARRLIGCRLVVCR
jgi:hypothetical protein